MKPLEIPPDIVNVSRETLEKLQQYHALLLKWQEKINLVSPATIPAAWDRHFIDSAQLAPLLPDGPQTVYDLGSGAGFAGMVLAILRPDIEMTFIESDAKKCSFLGTVSRETGIKVIIRNERIEAAVAVLPAPQIVTARALASLTDLFAYVRSWAEERADLRLIFPKGAQADAEIQAAKSAGWDFDYKEIPSKTEPAARILVVVNLCKKRV